MTTITESIARALTLEELAKRLADYHDDAVTRYFARRIVDEGVPTKEEVEELQAKIDRLEDLPDYERELETLQDDIRLAIKTTEDRQSLVDELEGLI